MEGAHPLPEPSPGWVATPTAYAPLGPGHLPEMKLSKVGNTALNWSKLKHNFLHISYFSVPEMM